MRPSLKPFPFRRAATFEKKNRDQIESFARWRSCDLSALVYRLFQRISDGANGEGRRGVGGGGGGG